MYKKRAFYLLSVLLSFLIFLMFTSFCYAEDTLAKILRTGSVRIGVKIDSPPFGFRDKDGKIKGFEIDLAKYIVDYISAKYGKYIKIDFIPVTPKNRLKILKEGKVDFVIATVTATYRRDLDVDFSIFYFITEGKIMVRKSSGIKSARDLGDKRIGVLKGSTSQNWLYRVNYKIYPVVYTDYTTALKDLEAGKIDGIASDELILIGLKNKSKIKNDLVLLPESYSFEQYAVAVRENDSNLRDEINFALMEALKLGDYDEMYEKWFVKNPNINLPMSERKAIGLILQCYFQ